MLHRNLLTADERRKLIETPFIVHIYGGKSHAGHCFIQDHDTAHARYLRAWRVQQQAGQSATHNNGYLP